ncbi:MAG: MerR family transcriptional regulator [Paenibacillaceae bacterium]|nr:MerR family transcriptional regulator [Paenibacillaceae bacterium]
MDNQKMKFFTIGDLAEKAGVSVRTLQYYDKTDLLKPVLSEGGRRMYTRDDIFRLQQILFFKSCGFSLEQIRERILKFKSASDLEDAFVEQREILSGQIENLNNIAKILDSVICETRKGREISLDKLMAIMYLMRQESPYTFMVSYFGSEQLKNITERFQKTDSQDKNKVIIENTKELLAELNLLYPKGADPASREGQELAKRWWEMVTNFTDGDLELLKTLVNAGMDIRNWPDETKDFREAIERFLGPALRIYLDGKNINLLDLGGDMNE